jgi:DNA (cytosine-5)-methyltransferase 1
MQLTMFDLFDQMLQQSSSGKTSPESSQPATTPLAAFLEHLPIIPSGGKWTNAGCVFGPQRAVAWRVLDAQYFGVAQRRKRVFVVASARDGFDPAAVLFEFQGLRRDTAPSREAGQTAAVGAGAGAASRGWPAEVSSTLDTTFGTKQGLEDQHVNAGCPLFVPVTMSSGQANASVTHDMASALTCLDDVQIVAECVQTLRTRRPGEGGMSDDHEHLVMQPVVGALCRDSFTGGAGGRPEGAAAGHFVPVAFHPTQDPISSAEVCHSIGANENATAAVAFTTEQTPKFNEEQALTLTKQSPTGGGQPQTVMTAMQVRRLTPVECERLQGFPDNYTAIPWRNKAASECPDGPRYKALGNSWAVPWIGKRINEAVHQIAKLKEKNT